MKRLKELPSVRRFIDDDGKQYLCLTNLTNNQWVVINPKTSNDVVYYYYCTLEKSTQLNRMLQDIIEDEELHA